MITTEMTYWIIMLDNISKALVIGGAISAFILAMWSFSLFLKETEYHWSYPVFLATTIFLVLGAVFVPDSKQMAAIYLLPNPKYGK